MGKLSIDGTPVVSIEFEGLPTLNSHYGKHWRARSVPTAEWRYEARVKALDVMGAAAWLADRPFIRRGLVLVDVYPPFEEISDIHNVHIKPILDGFSDANLWADDEWAFVPVVVFRWAGLGNHKPRERARRVSIFHIYELEQVSVGGVRVTLPAGRTKTEKK